MEYEFLWAKTYNIQSDLLEALKLSTMKHKQGFSVFLSDQWKL